MKPVPAINHCTHCGKITWADSVHTCTPPKGVSVVHDPIVRGAVRNILQSTRDPLSYTVFDVITVLNALLQLAPELAPETR